MSKELTIHGEALGASQKGALAVEQFLKDNYLFRFNELSGKVEFVTLPAGENPDWRVLTEKALNSIILRAKREDVCEGANPKSDIQMLVNSDDVVTFNPITWYLNHLPKWNGQNHVARLFGRLPDVEGGVSGGVSGRVSGGVSEHDSTLLNPSVQRTSGRLGGVCRPSISLRSLRWQVRHVSISVMGGKVPSERLESACRTPAKHYPDNP